MPQLRNGKIVTPQFHNTKGFNVKSRAIAPQKENVFCTRDSSKEAIAAKYGVNIFPVGYGATIFPLNICPVGRPILEGAYGIENWVSQKMGRKYLLIGYGYDYLYYSPAPLTMRGPRPNAAKKRYYQSDYPLLPDDVDHLLFEVNFDKPVVEGSDKPTRDTVMKGSALWYAKDTYGEEWARNKTWEWLHIIGHSLGGNNEIGNLVAGTYDANTQMIPHERKIRDASQNSSVIAKFEVNLFPGTWIAIDITMTYSWVDQKGFNFEQQTFNAQTDISFDKLQYDLWLHES